MSTMHWRFRHDSQGQGCTVGSHIAIALLRRHARRAWLIWFGVVVVAFAGWFLLRTGEGAQFNSVEDYEAALRTGQPTLVEFYSDY
jgi:hypothetical protein